MLLDAVPVLPRELRACSEWKNPAGPITPPTQFLVGAETRSAVYLSGLEELTAAFTDIQRVEIAGQQHVAHVFAAETFSEPVAEFCRE